MLTRIFLIVAILAGIGAGVVNFVVVKDKIGALTDDRNTQRSGKEKALSDLSTTNKFLVRVQENLRQTRSQLADANAARKSAEDTAAAQRKRADDLNDKLTQTGQKLESAENDLAAYQGTHLTPEQILKLTAAIKQSNEALDNAKKENMVLFHSNVHLSNELARVTGTEDYVVKLPADLKGNVTTVDPKWDFVVLNIGDDQGVLEDGELLVNRDGKLVAKVVVRSIEKHRCIANIVPGWKIGEVFEGDEVIPAHPAT